MLSPFLTTYPHFRTDLLSKGLVIIHSHFQEILLSFDNQNTLETQIDIVEDKISDLNSIVIEPP